MKGHLKDDLSHNNYIYEKEKRLATLVAKRFFGYAGV